jgi:Domain of unknown function (DUF4160)
MPVIARFYGIIIRMYFREHVGAFAIQTLEKIEGNLPQRAERLVRDWATQHQADLQEMWDSRKFKPLPGLD